jgi:5-methylcytosine-specific restriction protein A
MPLLYYWRGDNYRRDLDMGAGYHLNQASPVLHRVDLGDSVWAFTRRADGAYVLAAELVVKAKTLNRPGFRYGRYRVWGDLVRSRYFTVDGQPAVEQVIRALSIRAASGILGRAFQGAAAVRPVTHADHLILAAAAHGLPPEPRARILPEERLEAALLLGDPAVERLVLDEAPGLARQRREYLSRQAPARDRQIVLELRDLYAGRCQVCAWDPRAIYGRDVCHAHHLQWLSRGGDDSRDNMVVICPNHHAAIHRCDAPFDFGDYSFVFAERREPLRLDLHLGA